MTPKQTDHYICKVYVNVAAWKYIGHDCLKSSRSCCCPKFQVQTRRTSPADHWEHRVFRYKWSRSAPIHSLPDFAGTNAAPGKLYLLTCLP